MSTVLIGAEEPIVARILAHKLRREGHEVVCVRQQDALAAACASSTPDVIIVDAALVAAMQPGVTLHPRCGWLLLTGAFDDAAAVHAAMQAGAAGTVRLPFKPTQVAAQVATLMSLAPA